MTKEELLSTLNPDGQFVINKAELIKAIDIFKNKNSEAFLIYDTETPKSNGYAGYTIAEIEFSFEDKSSEKISTLACKELVEAFQLAMSDNDTSLLETIVDSQDDYQASKEDILVDSYEFYMTVSIIGKIFRAPRKSWGSTNKFKAQFYMNNEPKRIIEFVTLCTLDIPDLVIEYRTNWKYQKDSFRTFSEFKQQQQQKKKEKEEEPLKKYVVEKVPVPNDWTAKDSEGFCVDVDGLSELIYVMNENPQKKTLGFSFENGFMVFNISLQLTSNVTRRMSFVVDDELDNALIELLFGNLEPLAQYLKNGVSGELVRQDYRFGVLQTYFKAEYKITRYEDTIKHGIPFANFYVNIRDVRFSLPIVKTREVVEFIKENNL